MTHTEYLAALLKIARQEKDETPKKEIEEAWKAVEKYEEPLFPLPKDDAA